MKLKALLLSIFIIAISGCSNQENTKSGNHIDAKLRETISAYNKRLLQAMVKSNNQTFIALGTPMFIKTMHSKLDRAIWPFRRGLLGTEFTVYEEFYTHHTTVPENYKIQSEKHNFEFTFTNRNKETYVSMLKLEHQMDSYLVTFVYELVDGEWLVNDIFAGLLATYGKDSQAYYEMAKAQAKKGYVIDAFIYDDIAEDLLDPANGHLKYNNEDKIKLALKIWHKEVNQSYQFPVVLEDIATQPQIMGIAPIKNANELTIVVNYVTRVPFGDKAALEAEYKKVKQSAEKTFKSYDFSKKYIYYRAYTPGGLDFISFTDEN